MEGDGLCLDFALLHIDLVTAEDDGNVLADTDEVACDRLVRIPQGANQDRVIHTVPVRDVLVGDAGGHIEHDDAALAVDVVAITETTKLLLASSIPDVELNLTEVLVLVSDIAT